MVYSGFGCFSNIPEATMVIFVDWIIHKRLRSRERRLSNFFGEPTNPKKYFPNPNYLLFNYINFPNQLRTLARISKTNPSIKVCTESFFSCRPGFGKYTILTLGDLVPRSTIVCMYNKL
jgi:hypothetical protein